MKKQNEQHILNKEVFYTRIRANKALSSPIIREFFKRHQNENIETLFAKMVR